MTLVDAVPAAEFSTEVARRMPERELQAYVEAMLKAFGWRYYHTHDSRHSAAGFFDLVAVRPPRVVFVELKSETGKLTEAQMAWYDDLELVFRYCKPGEVYVWRPRHWLDGTVERLLR